MTKKQFCKDQLKALTIETYDFTHKVIQFHKEEVHLFYLYELVDSAWIYNRLIDPLIYSDGETDYQQYLFSLPQYCASSSVENARDRLYEGFVIVVVNDKLFSFEASSKLEQADAQGQLEPSVLGSNEIFSTSLIHNIQLLRKRYLNSTFMVERSQLGQEKKLGIAIVYDRLHVDEMVLDKLRQRLKLANDRAVVNVHDFPGLLQQNKYSIIPNVMTTERIDRTVQNVQNGKVIVMVEGSALIQIIPTTFFEFMSASDDLYQLSLLKYFMKFFRYVALFITVMLPSLYLVVTSYNPEALRLELALTIAGSRLLVPYPTFVELLVMLLMVELLSEASIRLPTIVGPAGTTVGGLILGQAATEAGIASNIMVIIISLVAISGYVIPITHMSFAIRMIKYPILFVSILFGIMGVLISSIVLFFYVCQLDNFNKPYIEILQRHSRKED